ncbi:MAG: hypothetical protein ACFFCQ_06885 [Promethearchaeota archaeon]
MTERTISFRIQEKLFNELEEIAQKEQKDRSAVARRLLELGIHQEKLERAIDQYSRGKKSLSAAAAITGLDIRTLMEALNRSGLEIQVGLGQFLETLDKMKEIRENK